MSETLHTSEAQDMLVSLRGRVVWKVTTSGASGGTFSIHFAEPMARGESQGRGGDLTLATHEGEYQLYVFCDWLVNDEALQNWDCTLSEENAALLRKSESKALVEINIDEQGILFVDFPDLRIRTSGENGCLHDDVLWSVITPTHVISFEMYGGLVLEDRPALMRRGE